eukprot:m.52578 g.52578  ORF g.52578 m.52578 type:complete len:155 (+) comp13511_c0_seq2:1521-1985(+)
MAVLPWSSVPYGALSLTVLVGVLLVDIQIDTHASHEVRLAYYQTTQIDFPLRVAILLMMAIAALDLLIMAVVRFSRLDLVSLTVAGYLLYLFIGAVQPQLDAATAINAKPVIIKAALATLADVHLIMLPTVVLLIMIIAFKHRAPVTIDGKKSN